LLGALGKRDLLGRDESRNGKFPYRPTPNTILTDRISYFREKTDSGKNSGKTAKTGSKSVEAFFRLNFRFPFFTREIPDGIPVFIFRLDSSPLALPAHKPAKLMPAAIAPSEFSWWAGLLAFIANLSCPLRSADEVGLNLDQLAAWLLHACRCAHERLCAVLSCNGPQGPGGQQQHVLTKPGKRKLAEQVYFYISFFLNDYLLSFFSSSLCLKCRGPSIRMDMCKTYIISHLYICDAICL